MTNTEGGARSLLLQAAGGVALCLCCALATQTWAQEGPFDLTCPLPYADIAPAALGQPIDAVCDHDGKTASAAASLQNMAKNNLCAQGSPVRLTRHSFVQLQNEVEAAGISFGSSNNLPDDRTPLKDIHHTSDGQTVGEGSLVRLAAFVLDAHYSNVSKGESVNCKEKGEENNEIHVAVAESADADLCNSITVEIIPHYRPAAWTPDILDGLDHPVRITGQLFFDGSHKPCTGGHRASPARVSVWEIHPVYAIDVCKNKTLASCKAEDDSKWTPIHEWFGLEEDETE